MRISPVEDVYAKKNGEISNNDIFYIQGFNDNKESIKKLFNYIRTTISLRLPFNKSSNVATLVFKKDDIEFEDGSYNIDGEDYMMIFFNSKNYNYFRVCKVILNYNKLDYVIDNKKVIIDYKEFNLEALQNFYDIIEKIYKKTKQTKFLMVKKKSSNVECIVEYNNNFKDDAFTIEFK